LLKLTKSCHDQDCIEIRNPTEHQRNTIRSIVMNNWVESEDYKMKQSAGPFLQCDYEDYLLVEFWGDTEFIQPFIDYLNKKLEIPIGTGHFVFQRIRADNRK